MSEHIIRDEDAFFQKTLLVFSVLVPLMALGIYLSVAIQPLVLGIAAVIAVLLSVLGGKYLGEKKAVRVLVRVLYLLIPAAMLLLALVLLIVTLAMGSELVDQKELTRQTFSAVLVYLKLNFQIGLLCVLPAVGFCTLHRRPFDLIVMRLYAAVELLLALLVCFHRDEMNPLLFLIDNVYVNAVFCLCAAVLLVCSFALEPPKRWPFKKTYEKWRASHPRPVRPEAEETPEGEPDTTEKPASEPGEALPDGEPDA